MRLTRLLTKAKDHLLTRAVCALVFLLCATALHAQLLPCEVASVTETSQTCAVGSSFYFDLGALFELGELTSIIDGNSGASFTYTFAVTAGALPPGLTLTPSGLFTGTLTAAGTYSFTVSLTEVLTYDGTTYFDESVPFPLGFVVTGYSGPALTVDPSALSFNLTQGGAGVTQSVGVTNNSTQAVQFSASATTSNGGNWLQLGSTGGSIASFGSSSVAITANASNLPPGTYSGAVIISVPGGQTLGVSVVAVVAGTQPNIELSQTGLRFQAVQGGAATSPQGITLLNSGAGTVNFSANASTITGANWLSVSPSSGSSSSSAAGSVTVSVNPSGLQPGDYYGMITFSASGAVNSPQVASVVLNVVSPANSPGAFVQPSGLIFVGSAGGTNPTAQTLSITNPSPDSLMYLVTPFSNNATNWLTAAPASGSVSSTQPATISVQPVLQGLTPGVYIGDLTFTIAPGSASAGTGTPQILHVEILLLVLPAGVSPSDQSASQSELRPHTVGCTPSKLLPVFTQLGTGFTAAAAWPTAIQLTVVDDCGNPLVSGSLTATFSSGDPALSLDSLKNGNWSGTWNATHAASGVTITAQAQEVMPALTGNASIGGTVEANTTTPSVSAGGVIGIFNSVANQPLAPGGYAAIYGSNLSQASNVSTQYPFSLQLGNTSVILGSKQLPIYFTSSDQINVVLPYDVPANSTQQLVVQNGSAISIPQTVVIASAQPAILAGSSGTAFVSVFQSDGTALPDDSPVTAGDVIILYCSGLGAVNPPVAAGSPAPSSLLSSTVNPVTVMIGQTPAQVLFAGLVPTYAQLYQVNVQVPAGLPSGAATLTVSVGGQQSAPVTITVQ